MAHINDLKHAWFLNKTGVTNLGDAQMAYFRSKSGLTNTPTRIYYLSEHQSVTLTLAGFGTSFGNFEDRMIAFYKTKTGINSLYLGDQEQAFYANNSYDFA